LAYDEAPQRAGLGSTGRSAPEAEVTAVVAAVRVRASLTRARYWRRLMLLWP
jgi:hypothetical protein